jgi:thiol-disulfide isomerase/thioredoxin
MSNRPSSSKSGRKGAGSPSARVAQARQGGSGSARWWIIGAVALVVVAALAAAVWMTRPGPAVEAGVAGAGFDARPGAPADLVRGTVQVTGAPLPELPQSAVGVVGPDPAAGADVPALAGQRFDGQPLTIPAAGRPKVVMFVAHWCPHCQKEVPLIAEHLGGKLPADVDLFTVSTGVAEDRPNFPPGPWLRRENWPVPTMVDDQASNAAKAYGLSSYPFFVAVDGSGKVVVRRSGELKVEEFDALLTAARTGSAA